ncbi:MAG: M23 family metallopeptidase [Gammaproteobacteria bacterium]|nr:M23 family metallopeptidase [Gammaproteobacteria bacterium]
MLKLKRATDGSATAGRLPSVAFWLQASACTVVGWSLLHGGITIKPAAPPVSSGAAHAPGPAFAGVPAAAEGVQPAPAPLASPRLAAAPALAEARLALSTIDVIVSRNDTLDRIFRRLKLNLGDLASLRGLPGIRATLDSLRPGELLHLTRHDGQLVALERRLNESQTLKVSRDGDGGALKADVVQNPLETRPRTVRGTIDSSLFEAVAAAGADDQTALALADIFGWDIDFVLDVRPGDSFVITYDQVWRDGTYLHDGTIAAAEFVNQGRTFRAVRYTDAAGHAAYYTPEGRSMRKEFLRTPVEFTRVSSRFNSARLHPILNTIRAHRGVDYAAPIGTPVHAAGDGRVRFAGPVGGYGNMVQIEHSRSIVTVYGHLSRFAHGIHAGTRVRQGEVIAYVGMTGLATGPHLHYEYRVNGVFKNPQTIPLPAAAPIDARWQADFLARAAPLLATLDIAPGPMLVSR